MTSSDNSGNTVNNDALLRAHHRLSEVVSLGATGEAVMAAGKALWAAQACINGGEGAKDEWAAVVRGCLPLMQAARWAMEQEGSGSTFAVRKMLGEVETAVYFLIEE